MDEKQSQNVVSMSQLRRLAVQQDRSGPNRAARRRAASLARSARRGGDYESRAAYTSKAASERLMKLAGRKLSAKRRARRARKAGAL